MSVKIAFVTGGNRGIGLEICRQLAEQGITVLMGGWHKLAELYNDHRESLYQPAT